MKNYLQKIYSLIIFTVLSGSAQAADKAQELTGLLNGIKTMRADFTQTIYDNRGQAIQKSTGKMALERPGKFRWQVGKPIPQTIIANSERLWIYDPDLEQVTIRSLKVETGEAPALILSHQNADLEKNYQIQSMKPQGTLQWFLLKPKKNDNMFASVKMGFANTQLKEMVLQDQIGHSTRVQFQKIEMNISLPSSLFKFIPPKGTDIIDETR